MLPENKTLCSPCHFFLASYNHSYRENRQGGTILAQDQPDTPETIPFDRIISLQGDLVDSLDIND